MSDFVTEQIPPQEDGEKVDIAEHVNERTEDAAKSLFRAARNRLLDISHWKQFSRGLSADFRLTDEYGKLKEGLPKTGDHFRIDIPGPGAVAGKGFDWVKLEQIEDNNDPDADTEELMITVRPAADPTRERGTAHFLQQQATSSFVIKRIGTTVSAEVHGRNEKPNKDAATIIDTLRNAIVGTAAMIGLSKVQWKHLTKGLLRPYH
jgi:hypothetical protein